MIPCSGRGFVLDTDQRPARARPVIQGFAGCRPIDTRIQKSPIATAGAVDSVLAAVREVFASARAALANSRTGMGMGSWDVGADSDGEWVRAGCKGGCIPGPGSSLASRG